MTNSKFIKIGDQRIRLSNVKDYGIRKVDKLISVSPEMYFIGAKPFFKANDIYEEKLALYIETYQGETHTFYEDDFNINKIVSEIDEKIT